MFTALYRKMRPKSFKDIVGQKPIVTTLTNQLRDSHVSHAYLFCGTRGTGKTTTAKVFARAVNCTYSSETGEPCNECDICLDILNERNFNVIEIDAASNNGVDNIRDLREEVKYPPTTGIFKVYIIDEAHMLTTAAFNALLKTLEEPPEHVIFILATTDPQKIPPTILSRCQRYDFKRISRLDMVNSLSGYMAAEGVNIDSEAIEYISSVSDGAMRDALSILDQCISLHSGELISLDKVQALLGAVDYSVLFSFSEALYNRNLALCLSIINNISKEGRDISRFVTDITYHFRNLIISNYSDANNDILDFSKELVEKYRAYAAKMDTNTIIKYIFGLSELQNQMRYSSGERLMLEVFAVKTCNENIVATETIAKPITIEKPVMPQAKSPEPIAANSDLKQVGEDWTGFCNSFSGLLKSLLALTTVKCDNAVNVICKDDSSLSYIKDNKNIIAAELKKYFNLSEEPMLAFRIADNADDNFTKKLQSEIDMEISFD